LTAEGTARLWDVESQQVVSSLAGPRIDYTLYGCVVFSPNGRLLAVGGLEPPIRLWEIAAAKETALPPSTSIEGVGVTALAFSPDSRLLAAGCGYWNNDVHLWDLEAATASRLGGIRIGSRVCAFRRGRSRGFCQC